MEGLRGLMNTEWESDTFLQGEEGLALNWGKGERGGRLESTPLFFTLNLKANSCIDTSLKVLLILRIFSHTLIRASSERMTVL